MNDDAFRVDVTVSGLAARYGATGVRALLKAIAGSTIAIASAMPVDDDQPAKKRPAKKKSPTKKQARKAARPLDWKPKGGRVAKDKHLDPVVAWFRKNGTHPAHACAHGLRLCRKAICKTVHRAVELGLLCQAGSTRPAQGGLPVLTYRIATDADADESAEPRTKSAKPATPAEEASA